MKEQVLKELKIYDVDISTTKQNNNIFLIDASEKKSNLSVSIQFWDDELYGIYFLNNQFFEMSENVLIDVLRDVLSGRYIVRGGKFFRSKKHIITLNHISPERIEDASEYLDVYKTLPRSFNKAQAPANTKN